MVRRFNHILLFLGLLWLLVGCGQISGGASISGTVRAPTGEDVAGTQVFACYENENNCDWLGEVTVSGSDAAALYQLRGLPSGRYGVYALKDANQDGTTSGNGDFFGYYQLDAGEPALVTAPAENIDIQMSVLTGASRVPLAIRELQTKIP